MSDIFYFLQSKRYPILSNMYHFLLAFTVFFIYFHSSAANPSSFQNLVAVSDASEHSSACFLTILLLSLGYCFTLSLCEGNMFFSWMSPKKPNFCLIKIIIDFLYVVRAQFDTKRLKTVFQWFAKTLFPLVRIH